MPCGRSGEDGLRGGGVDGSGEAQAEAPALVQVSDDGALPGRGRGGFRRCENLVAIVSLGRVGRCKSVPQITWPPSEPGTGPAAPPPPPTSCL